ncbi:hypothetical protein P2G88_01375 [Aliiglaciecola sp. CAU 1673]|uniref:hypothetical protein n=1 Tax=Aliiglaciecola sp. CAU 1673 TaxID=3032595 RepID=UPI0023DA770B|nr:hypothetical protein [Aliiglaciecola sp. CAU 1673]MDF2176902.1 hypothetical protein [Aliiglaciecola sp. CAU 1673]
MKRCLTLLSLLTAPALSADALQQVLETHQSSLGEVTAWQATQNISLKLSIKEPGFEVEGIYRASKDGKMRIDIFSEGKPVFTEAYNGKQGGNGGRNYPNLRLLAARRLPLCGSVWSFPATSLPCWICRKEGISWNCWGKKSERANPLIC